MAMSRAEDPRRIRSRETILAAAVELLVERGFAGATVEAISSRSGVAKTTIYRHWPDSQQLLLAAAQSAVPRATTVDSGDLRDDVKRFVRELVQVLATAPLSSIVPSLIDQAERSEDAAQALAEFTASRREPLQEALRHAADRGDPEVAIDPETMASLILGPLFYRRLLSRHAVTVEFAESVVDYVFAGVTSGGA